MTSPPGATPADQALHLAAGGALSELPEDADRLALAWALKDLCYAAWHSEPVQAGRAADALRALAAQAPGVPEIGALADWTAGIAAVTRGQVADAPALFDRAADALRRAGLADPAAQTQVPKIMALSMLGRHDEAVACALTAQRELRALGNLAAAARVSQNLGSLQLFRDDYAQAARHFREAAVLFARLRDHGYSVLADIGLAGALLAQGDFDEAGRIHARAAMRAANQGLALQQALSDDGRGLLHLARGDWRDALAAFEAARRRYEALALPQYLAVVERQLADVYLELNLLPEALALSGAAVAQFRGLGLKVEQAWALKQQGLAQALLRLPEADASLAEAARLFDAQGNLYGRAIVALARAELGLVRGDFPGALAQAGQAAEGLAAAGHAAARLRAEAVRAEALLAQGEHAAAGALFEATWAAACELQVAAVQVRCLAGRGELALARGDAAAAEAGFEAAIEQFEVQRAALPDDALRSAFLGGHLRPYQALLHLALARGDATAVLVQLDRCRARALDDRQAEAGAEDDSEAVRALRERVNWLLRRVQRLQDEGAPWQAPDEERRRLERELLEQARRRRLSVDTGARRGGAALDVPALQAALAPGDALVAYGADADAAFACVVTAAGLALCRLPEGWSALREAVQAFRFQAEALRHGTAALQRHLPTLQARAEARLRTLHGLVWAPLAEALAGARRVVVVPHGELAEVPFAALADADGPLGERLALAAAPSVRAALRGLATQPALPRRVRAFGESTRLPQAAAEARFVARLFDEGQAFVGAEATLATLQAQAAGANVLHLACHAEFRVDNPRFSALHLADAQLTVDLAEALPLRGCTVVLSACETGLAERSSGDEHLGLVRGFLVAGAARVVASLWPVDDVVTAAFMEVFYRALAGGAGTAEALAAAMAHTRRTHPHPCFWGAFTLLGGW